MQFSIILKLCRCGGKSLKKSVQIIVFNPWMGTGCVFYKPMKKLIKKSFRHVAEVGTGYAYIKLNYEQLRIPQSPLNKVYSNFPQRLTGCLPHPVSFFFPLTGGLPAVE
jgi:hypothetical protein